MWFSRLIGITVIESSSDIEPRIGKQSPRKGNHSGAVIDHQGVSGMPLIQDKWTLQGIILYYGLKTISMYLAFYELSKTGCLPQGGGYPGDTVLGGLHMAGFSSWRTYQ